MSTRRAVYALIFGLTLLGPTDASAGPWPNSPAERAQTFAICAGRFSAQVDHDRTVSGFATSQVEARRGMFVALLDAVLPDALEYGLPKAQAMDWLLHAKLAQSRLLMRADFYSDASIKQKARAAADAFLQECSRFLLG